MSFEQDIPQLGAWLPGAAWTWALTLAVLALVTLGVGYTRAALLAGPVDGGVVVYRWLRDALTDLLDFSPRRCWALARLSIQESVRRWVGVGFVLFALLLLFSPWFLDAKSIDPATLYTDSVLSWILMLVLPLAVLLSAFSLPNDLKHKTIYTVVTKPVRAGEIVLGRFLGFALVGTLLLTVMGGVGYLFVLRAVDHRHELPAAALKPVERPGGASAGAPDGGLREGPTSAARGHQHRAVVEPDGRGLTDTVQGHWHEIATETGPDGQPRLVLGPPLGQFHARVPVLGTLEFKDRTGVNFTPTGVSVGYEWKYRSYLEGGTLAAAVFRFRGLRERDFPDGLPLELTLRVFRTVRGDVKKPIDGELRLRNPRTRLATGARRFPAREFAIDAHFFPRQLADEHGRPIELFRDLVDDGELEVEVQCLDAGQYFGLGRGDVYLLAADRSFGANFFKGLVGIWLAMLLVIALAVAYSTFLNALVTLLATIMTVLGGFCLPFIRSVVSGESFGPFESLVRIVTQKPYIEELDPGLGRTFVETGDQLARVVLDGLLGFLPDFAALGHIDFVRSGIDIPLDLLGRDVLVTLGFLIPLGIAGYLCFKLREIAR